MADLKEFHDALRKSGLMADLKPEGGDVGNETMTGMMASKALESILGGGTEVAITAQVSNGYMVLFIPKKKRGPSYLGPPPPFPVQPHQPRGFPPPPHQVAPGIGAYPDEDDADEQLKVEDVIRKRRVAAAMSKPRVMAYTTLSDAVRDINLFYEKGCVPGIDFEKEADADESQVTGEDMDFMTA